MEEIKLTINGKEVTGEKGDTILEVCQKNGIDVPTLCHYDHLDDIGGCRMCIVEIEGARGYQSSCSMEAADGMIVQTETKEIKEIRCSLLELLFSERNHYCLFCEATGDCELQQLAYQHGIEHIRYQYAFPEVRTDSSRSYFVFDDNRCILCRRCIRACSDIAGHNVLDARERGEATRIIADLNESFADSSCTTCGTCLQVCPTGALFDRKSAYMGKKDECETTKSICAACSIGCGIEVTTRFGHMLQIYGDWEGEVNNGLLCVAGRFEPLYSPKERLLQPMIKKDGEFEEVEWQEALDYVTENLQKVGTDNFSGIISPRATNEEAQLFVDLLGGSDSVKEMGSTLVSVDKCDGSLDDIQNSDCILVYKIDLDEEIRVAGSFVKLAVYKDDAKLILVDDEENSYERHAVLNLNSDEIDEAKELLNNASNPLIIYGTNASVQEVEKLVSLCESAKMLGLVAGANSRGLMKLGINGSADIQNAKGLYLLACDDELNEVDRGNADFVILQSSYFTPEAEKADVILPSTIWAEKEGTFTNVDGKTQKITKIIDAPDSIQANETWISDLLSNIE